jgi:hypothetical protein
MLTRLGGARLCLRLVVTRDVLWVTSWFPFSMITPFYDLEHIIPRERITAVRRSWVSLLPAVLVTFRDAAVGERTLSLYPWRPAELVRSLGGETPARPAEPAAAAYAEAGPGNGLCPHCGGQLPDVTDAFCPECREPLS